MSCDPNKLFINLYFFQNGSCCRPEKVRVRKSEIEKVIQHEGKFCYFRGKCIFSVNGECINSLSKFIDNCAYVLVMPMDQFQPLNYSRAFNNLKQKISSQHTEMNRNRSCQNSSSCNYRKCQSTPAIPMSCRKSSEQCVRFAPCDEDESSEEECPYFPLPNDKCQKQSLKKKPVQQQPTKVVKKGFGAKCCPCCVKGQPSLCPSKPMIECGNGKMTQTTVDDFKCSIARMKRAVQEEKKRQRIYKKSIRKDASQGDIKPAYCPQNIDDADPKMIKKFELARKQLQQRQLKLSEKISSSLDKKYGNELKRNC